MLMLLWCLCDNYTCSGISMFLIQIFQPAIRNNKSSFDLTSGCFLKYLLSAIVLVDASIGSAPSLEYYECSHFTSPLYYTGSTSASFRLQRVPSIDLTDMSSAIWIIYPVCVICFTMPFLYFFHFIAFTSLV